MTPEEARFLLAAVRSDRLPPDDPRVAEALQLARTDPALREWWQREQDFDHAMAAHLAALRPPPQLRNQILAGQRASKPFRRWTLPRPRRLLALAAGLTLLAAALSLFITGRTAGPDRLASEVARFLDEEWDHDFEHSSSSFGNLKDWLAAKRPGLIFEVPPNLASQPTFGCLVFSWRGYEANLICFRVAELQTVVHVVSLPADCIPSFDDPAPRLQKSGMWNTATWRQGSRIYVALSIAPHEALARFVGRA